MFCHLYKGRLMLQIRGVLRNTDNESVFKINTTDFRILWPLFMDGVQLPHGQSNFEEAVYFLPPLSPRNSWYSLQRPRKDERLSQPWSHPVVLNTGPLDWESSALTTRSRRFKRFFDAFVFGKIYFQSTRKNLRNLIQGCESTFCFS